MLLTTNRESTIDAAFKSRIHLTIHYPKLGPETRRRIWQNFIEPVPIDSAPGHISISPDQLDALAEEHLNGREIKSVVRAARLLSSYYSVPLSFEHLTTVIKVKNEEREGRNTMS
jgi:AAA+ superfamily predicted ATPase